MSVFSNRFDAAVDEADAYVRAVVELVGARPPIEILSELQPALETLVRGVWEDDLRQPEADGKWSMLDTILHLLDSEVVWGYRLRTVLAEDRPPLTGFDQDRWASGLHGAEAPPDVALDALFALRAFHVAMIRSLDDEALARVGEHSERGEESVRHMLVLYAGHDLVHRRQLERIRSKVVDGEGS